jgi:hypothetical protein
MRKINRLKSKSPKETCTVYTYEVVDEQGNLEDVTSLQKFDLGERVMVWFDTKYNMPKLKKFN